ncbi:MAG: segregation/condensation protein A [Ilumatobacteraceae bacterium]
MGYEVSTPVFAGPFDLLLHLMLSEELDIHEVSLSKIIEAYLAEIEKMKTFDLDVATEFLLIAATLIELKTRRLLPNRDDTELDDEFAMWEERDLLLARLLDCKTFKDVAGVLGTLIERADLSFPRVAGPDERYISLMPDLLEGVTPSRLQRALLKVTAPKPHITIDMVHVTPIRASVADALIELIEFLPTAGEISFSEISRGIKERVEVIVRFLALLELFKQGRVELVQGDRFGDVGVLWTGGSDRTFDAILNIDDYEG